MDWKLIPAILCLIAINATSSPSPTPSPAPSPSPSPAPSPSPTPSPAPSPSPTPSPAPSPSPTPSPAPSPSPTPSPAPSPSPTPSPAPSPSPTPSPAPSPSPTPSPAPSPSPTPSPAPSPSPTPSPAPSPSPTPSPAPSPSPTPSPAPSPSPTPSPAPSPSPTPSTAPSPSPTPSTAPSPSPTPSTAPSPSPTPSPAPSPAPSPSPTPSPSPAPSPTPSPAPSPTPSPAPSPTPSPAPSPSPTPSIASTQSPTPSIASTQSPTPSNSTNTPPVAAAFSLVFSINEIFVPALGNPSSPEFAEKAKSIRKQLEPIYKQKFKNFIKMVIHNFREGSIVTDSTLEFSATGSIPTNTIVEDTLVDAASTMSNFNILPDSISVIEVPATRITSSPITTTNSPSPTTLATTTSPQIVTAIFNLIFSIKETFDADLANPSSPQFATKSKQILNGVEPLYKKAFQNFLLMKIADFKNGSILTNSILSFGPGGSVTKAQVKDTLANGLASLDFTVDPNSISVTQILGNSMPPVIASSLSMIWMCLLSLLLSVALHC